MKKILIALDIDGTITSDLHSVPNEVIGYLSRLVEEGHQIVLITGRCFSLAYSPLQKFFFPYHLAVLNGAAILRMPERSIISKQYLDLSILPQLDQIVEGEETDYVLYTGIESGDLCYYRPRKFSPFFHEYIQRRAEWSREEWRPVTSFKEPPSFLLAAVKLFGKRKDAERLQKAIEQKLSLHAPVIRDPFDETVYLVQATHPQVTKGTALTSLKNKGAFVIAGGDDLNDFSMLAQANIRIVMETAPKEVRDMAHIIAKPARNMGIIAALEEALERVRDNRI